MSNLKKLIEEKIQWIIRDFSYKAPEQVTKDFVTERYIPILNELLALMDEAEQKPSWEPRASGKQVPEETSSSTEHQAWLRERQNQNPLNPMPVLEPKPAEKPAWEPGMPCAERGCEPVNHKFKVGDWFQTESVIRQMVAIANKKGWIEGNDGMIYDPICCRHVPPPKEVMPSEAVRTTVQNSAVTGAHRAVETSENLYQYREDLQKLEDSCHHPDKHSSKHSHGPECEDPFQGAQWDDLDREIDQLGSQKASMHGQARYQELLRQRDLRDELRRMRGGKRMVADNDNYGYGLNKGSKSVLSACADEIDRLEARVKELQEELDCGGHKFQIVAAELDSCREQLQSARELAEMVTHTANEPIGAISCVILRFRWEDIQAKAREFLEGLE